MSLPAQFLSRILRLPYKTLERSMAKSSRLIAKISTRGRLVLPKAIRDRRGWKAGAELIVEERPDGVLLRAAPARPPSRVEKVFGSLGPVSRVASIEEMHQALLDEAARRYRKAVDDRD
jgi:AbrB family looped-hinge helix DNA binding protein